MKYLTAILSDRREWSDLDGMGLGVGIIGELMEDLFIQQRSHNPPMHLPLKLRSEKQFSTYPANNHLIIQLLLLLALCVLMYF